MKKKILWNITCPFHNIPLLADIDSVFAFCPKCNCSYFIYEVEDPIKRQALIKSKEE